MIDPRENPDTDELAEPRRQLLQIEAEIQQTQGDYRRIVHEGSGHFRELHRKAQDHLDLDNVDEYVEQAHALGRMVDRHATAAGGMSL
jgi:glutamine synthetase type III